MGTYAYKYASKYWFYKMKLFKKLPCKRFVSVAISNTSKMSLLLYCLWKLQFVSVKPLRILKKGDFFAKIK